MASMWHPFPAIHAAFFFQPGCDECDRSEHDLQYIQEKYPQLVVHRFDVKDQAVLNQYLSNRAGVPDDEKLTAPALFVGDGYLIGVGFGFLRVLSSLSFLAIIGRWVYGVTLLLCLALAWGSFFDYRKAEEGRLSDMSLKLPDRLRGWIRTLIRDGTSARRFVLSSFAMGFAVSIAELACTGQVYLPTIIFVLGVPEWRAQASAALVLYNVMFILPLIGVFLLVYYGTTSQQLIDWMTRHTARVKLGTTVLFLLLAGWLGYSVVTS